MSKQELELKYFSFKGKYSPRKSETVRQEYKEHPQAKNKASNAIKAFDSLFKKS